MIALLAWMADATIKGSILIVLVALVHRLVGARVDARWRHALWIVVLLRLALPVAPETSWSLFNLLPQQQTFLVTEARVMVAAELSSAPVARAVPRVQPFERSVWSTGLAAILGVWLAGVVLLALRMVVASLRLDFAVARAARTSNVSDHVRAVLDEGRRQLGVRREVRIVECDLVKTPALHGLLRPTLLLPRGLAATFTRDELRHVVLHELWHLKRLDVAVSWLLAAVQTLHWFNPFVWFAASRIHEERELACDELALSCLEEEERLDYGRTILKLLERFRTAAPLPALVGIVNRKQKMKRRLMMIASFRNRTRFSILFLVVVAAVGAVGLTDAQGGERRVIRQLDPGAVATIEKLQTPVSLELTNASFVELLNGVANGAGVTIGQAPELATSAIQQARFTVKAENVPAHAVLMGALTHFELTAKPEAAGVTIVAGGAEHIMLAPRASVEGEREFFIRRRDGAPAVAVPGEDGAVAKKVFVFTETDGKTPGAEVQGDRIFVHRRNPEAHAKALADGKLRTELTMQLGHEGNATHGKLTIEISNLPQAK